MFNAFASSEAAALKGAEHRSYSPPGALLKQSALFALSGPRDEIHKDR
jgi:hypothetical protein